VPNIRILAYSDGQHNPADGSTLVNSFAKLSPSPLMTAFIGDPSSSDEAQQGAREMNELATTCPEHGIKGYFQIDGLAKHAQLRNLFRMASGASGFCPSCISVAVAR